MLYTYYVYIVGRRKKGGTKARNFDLPSLVNTDEVRAFYQRYYYIGNILMSFLDRIQDGIGMRPIPPSKKVKLVQEEITRLFHSLMSQLLELRDSLNKKYSVEEKVNLEIEIRFGMLTRDNYRRWCSLDSSCFPGTREHRAVIATNNVKRNNELSFSAGIDEILYNRLRQHIFIPEIYKKLEQSIQLQRSVQGPGNLRWLVPFENPDFGELKLLESKSKLHELSTDIAMLGHYYDIRIGCATENAISPGA